MKKITLLLADDHPVVRHGFRELIEKDDQFKIVAECGNGKDAYEKILELNPDIAVLDISMPELNGLQIVEKIQKEKVNTEFIILTMFEEAEYFDEALKFGVKGYLLKESALSELLGAAHKVAVGKYFISPSISGHLVKSRNKISEIKLAMPSLDDLTQGERKILKLIAENKTSKEIGEELFISYKTVQNHRNNICNKFGLKGHNKLLQFAIENKKLL